MCICEICVNIGTMAGTWNVSLLLPCRNRLTLHSLSLEHIPHAKQKKPILQRSSMCNISWGFTENQRVIEILISLPLLLPLQRHSQAFVETNNAWKFYFKIHIWWLFNTTRLTWDALIHNKNAVFFSFSFSIFCNTTLPTIQINPHCQH